MSEEELIETLKSFEEKRVEQLPESARNLFYAIMKIADERDEFKQEIERLNNIINGMEKFFKYAYDNEVRPLNDRKVSVWTICLDKLQELKGSESNE